MAYLLGCIADDLTGATDLAGMLVKNGMRVLQMVGHPDPDFFPPADADAIVIALKIRSLSAREAVDDALRAGKWLTAHGCRQVYWKYCSTFDSTPAGNIGPVAEALADTLGCPATVVCPAFPETGRTVYQGHLFVYDTLLNESGMRHHPLNPMTDASVVRLMQVQVSRPVGLLPWQVLRKGPAAVRRHLAALRDGGVGFIVTDALHDDDLVVLGEACRDLPLITGGSGLGMGLARHYKAVGLLPENTCTDKFRAIAGPTVILSGSCSTRTLEQVEWAKSRYPAFRLDPRDLAADFNQTIERLGARVIDAIGTSPVLVYASAPPDEVSRIKAGVGSQAAGELVERAMGTLARGLLHQHVTRFVVAGGETAGAVVAALGLKGLRIGPEIDPGVPWTFSLEPRKIALALKSGNFGAVDFFSRAIDTLDAMGTES